MNPTLLHRINALESEMDAEHDLLAQCAASGQMDASQVAAHLRAGELLPIGDQHSGIVGHGIDLRNVATEPIYTDSAYRDAGYEAAGIWFIGPEPEEPKPVGLNWPLIGYVCTFLAGVVWVAIIAWSHRHG